MSLQAAGAGGGRIWKVKFLDQAAARQEEEQD